MKRIGIIFGGKSGEHEVSLASAQSIAREIDKEKYIPILIGISKRGKWYYFEENEKYTKCVNPMQFIVEENGVEIIPVLVGGDIFDMNSGKRINTKIDIVFPVLHGTFGEDGTIQGLFEMADMPYVGAGVLGSSVGMDKVVSKRLLVESNIPVTPYLISKKMEKRTTYDFARKKLGDILFIKPANLGSSVGVNKVTNEDEFNKAINDAFLYDEKILIEKAIVGQEVECSVLGLDEFITGVPSEVIPAHDFYSYDAKYLDKDGAKLLIPANLDENKIDEVKKLAILAFNALECEIMARVDFLIEKTTGKIFVNEINTIPGFTSISMYPKMMVASGIPYKELISKLISLAEERYKRKSELYRAK